MKPLLALAVPAVALALSGFHVAAPQDLFFGYLSDLCGKSFEGFGRARFCSKPCQRHWDYRQHAESRRDKRRARYARQKEQPEQ